MRPEFSEYFKAHEPIGCRSPATAKAFMNIGVEAYFSGCLTLTLRLPKRERDGTIYAVDVEADLFEALVPGRVRQRCIHLTHDFPAVCSGTARKWMWDRAAEEKAKGNLWPEKIAKSYFDFQDYWEKYSKYLYMSYKP